VDRSLSTSSVIAFCLSPPKFIFFYQCHHTPHTIAKPPPPTMAKPSSNNGQTIIETFLATLQMQAKDQKAFLNTN